MKKLFVVSLMMAALALVAANSAFATAVVTNPANADISADLAATGGSGSYITTSIAIQELNNRDITNGTIILSVPTNFQFNAAAAVSASVTRGSGTAALLGLNSATAVVTTSNITVTVTNQDAGGTSATSRITWGNVQIRPLLGTPLATNTITMSTASTANILGITKGTNGTSFGLLRETLGAVNKLGYTTAPAATNTAGVALTNVVLQVQDQFGNIVSSNNVAVTLALNTGAFASGSTNATTGAGGAATFSNLVINTAGSYTLTASAPATSLSNSPPSAFIVLPGTPSALQILQDAPSSIFSGVTFPSNVTVQIADAFGNLVSNKTVTLSLLSGAPLSGTTSQPSGGNGVATFGGLSVAQAGSQALVASISSPSLSVTGATFTVNAGFASQLGYTVAPSTTAAGATMASVVVQVQDQAGNSIASNGVVITVALNAGAFASGTTTISTGPDGSATFSDLVINTAGNYTLTASDSGNLFTPTAPTPFTITPGTPTVIQITQDAPAVTNAGAVFSPPVTVYLADSLGNSVSNKTVTLTVLGGGNLNGTPSQATAGNGVATFANLNITVPGNNYSLVASISSPSLSVTGNTFTVTTANPAKLVYTGVPAVTNTAGSPLTTFAMQVEDQFSNPVATNGLQITMTLSNGTFASGTTTTNTDVNGSASIGDLVITNAGNNTVTASASGLTSTNKTLVIVPAPYAITFQQDAPPVTNAGALFSPPVAVKIADQYNNVLSNRIVTISLLNGGTLGGFNVRTTTVSGVASFTNLFINAAGTNYALLATSTNSLSVTGNTFIVTAAAANRLVFTGVPAITNVAGSQLSNFVMQVADQFNNPIATNGVPITMTLSNGTFASGTTTTNTDLNGSATIGDLVITNAGNNRVTASATGLTSTNKTLVILPAPFAITFQQDAPSITNAGAVFTPAVTVKIADQYSNFLTNRPVTMSLLNGGTLFGTLVRTTAVNGVATFNDLNIHVPGTNYALLATATNSLSVTGQTFTVTTAAASKLMYTTLPPSTVTAGATLSTFVVQVEDQFSNFIPGGGVPITLSLNTGSFASGTTNTVTDTDGSSTFFDVVINAAGVYTMTANSPGLTGAGRLVTVSPDTASNLTFVQQPPAVTNAGTVFTPAVTVKVTDEFNNTISNMTVIVTNNGGGTLNGTLSRTTATNGIATFNNLSVPTPGTGYFLTAITTNPALSVNSSSFNINVGPIDHYLVTATSPQMRGTPFNVTVTAQDVASNTVNDSSTVVTMSGSTANVQFDANGDTNFVDNTQTLSNGTFTITAQDNNPESVTITATDPNSKTGSTNITINAAAGDYRSNATGPWNTASTWQIWNGASWVTASTPPAGGAGTNITILSTHRVTNNVAVALSGTLMTQGSLSFNGGSITVGAGGMVLNSGTISSTASTLIFNSGGTYEHAWTTSSGTVPTAAWNSNSTFAVIGYTTFANNPSGFSQNFYHFVWNCPNQTDLISLGGNLTTVNGDFTVVSTGSGTLQGGLTATFNLTIAGDLNLQGGTFIGCNTGAGNIIKLGGSYLQTGGAFSEGASNIVVNFTGVNKSFIRSGGTINNSHMNFAVTNGASLTLNNSLSVSNGQNFTVFNTGTLNCGTNVVGGAGTFTLSAGGSLGIGSANGIAATAVIGNVTTTNRIFNIGGTYIYNGTIAQSTSNGMPATVRSLIVSNTANTVTLTANVTVSNDLTVATGTLDLGSFTANRATSGGTNTVANGATLKIGSTNTLPSNYTTHSFGPSSTVEYEGTAQNVSPQTYGNLTTSGSDIKTLLAGATSLAGDLNIGAGTTFNAVTNSFSIAGNLTNNGTAFAFSGPQTVTFTGSGTQNVSGASSIAFNTFAISSASVINLDDNDTALEFTIDGLDQAGGTWGSTASGATNPDDANFLGNGTLSVTPPTFGISFLQDAPAVTNAGAVFSPPVTVQLTSSATNLIVNQTVTITLNGGGLLGGTASQQTDTNGVATFSNLFINASGTNYSLTATITSPSLSVTGNTFIVTSAAATKLAYTTVPAAVTNVAGSTVSNFVMQVEDQFSNPVATNGVQITMSLSSGTFYTGTTTLFTGPDGSALSSDLTITNAGNNTVTATAAGLTPASKALVIIPAPYAITFQQDAPAITNAGAIFSPPVAVKIADLYNNVLSNRIVTISLLSGGNPGGFNVRTTTVSGVATFTNLFINVAGTNYALVASSTNSLSVTGNVFTVTTAPASKLIYTVLPPASTIAGATLTPFTVQVADQFNNSIATNGVPITMSLSNGTAFASGTTVSNTDVNGSAGFGDLVITNAGNRILVASAPGLTSTNRAITISPDVANATIAFLQGPAANMSAGVVFTNTVQLVDEFNNGLSNTTVTLTPNGFTPLNGTLSRATAGNGVATFNNLSVPTPGSNYTITATSGSLSTNSSPFNVNIGAIARYVVSASSPQTHDVPFLVTVTAQDAASNTVVADSSTVVTMNGSSVTVQFDANGDTNFVDNTQTLSNGTFTISTKDIVAETITITASDANGKTGTSPAITVTAAGGDYRSILNGLWSNANTWQVWDGANWVSTNAPPAGGAGTNITIQSGTRAVTNNVAIALSGTLINQGTLAFTSGSIAVGSGGLVQNSGSIVSSATTLLFNSGGTYQHAENGGTIPTAAYNSNSLLQVTGITSTIVTLPTSISGNVEWNCPNQTVDTAIILASATTIGGDFNIITTGSGSIIDGGTTARNLTVGGNMNVQGGTYYAIGGNGSSAGNVTVSVAQDLTVNGGNFSMVVGQGGTSSFNVSGTLIVGGDLAVNGGTLAILTNTTYSGSGVSSMTVSGNTSIAGGLLNLTSATSGNANGVTATLRGNLAISGGTISRGGTLPANVNFAGTNTQTYSKSGGAISGAVNFAVLQGATVYFGTSLLDGSSGTFTLNAGGRIGLGDPAGITTNGPTGNIQASGIRTYSTAGRYVYNGSVPQDTGNGLPSTVSSLTVSNTAATVTLDATVNVTSNLNVTAGTFDLGSFTADRITSGGTITVASGASLKIGGANTFPANYVNRILGLSSTVEYEGSAQNVTALPYANLVTSGSGTKTLQPGATTIASNLTVGSGTTLDAGTNDFSITGDWSNDGSFTATNTQTVTFNGASPQTIDGSLPTTFNNVAINSGSVLDLAIDGSTAQLLTIAGVNQPVGTYGATGSGATHIDDVDFQGTGTLNVLAALTVPSTTALATSGSPSTYGQPVTFTAVVTGTGPTPTGTVTFMDGASPMSIGTLDVTGLVTFATNTLAAGFHPITAVYSGDVNFNGSTSSAVTQQINQATLTVSGITAGDRPYNGNTNAALNTGSAALVGVVGSDDVTLNTGGAVGTFVNKNVGIGKTVNVSGLLISGADSGNYTLTQPTTTATISVYSITVTANTNTKVYDGLTNAAAIPSITSGTLQGTDAAGFSETYDNKNVGTGKTLTPAGVVVDGNSGNNYSVTFFPDTTGVISVYAITVTANTNTKVYDGLTNAAAIPSITSGTLQGTDTAGFSETYDNKNVGTGKTLTPAGAVVDGNSGNNYSVTFFPDTTGVISLRTLVVSATGVSRQYDGSTNATVTLSDDHVGSDSLTLNYATASFADKNVGTAKPVSVDGITATGPDSGNYTANTTATTTADITPAPLLISADDKTKTQGLPNPTLTATYTSFVGGDDTNALSTPVTLATTADANSPVGTYPITASDAVAANYTITFTNGTLTVVGVPQITNTKVSGNQFIFSFPTLLHEQYQVEFKDDLSLPTWTSVGGLIDGTGNLISVTNSITGSKRFYRVEVSPGN